MRRALPLVLASLALALLAGCGGSGERTATVGDARVTVPAGVDSLKGELNAILEQFPYQHWLTSCVEKRIGTTLTAEEEKGLSEASDSEREERLNRLVGKIGTACETSSDRPPVDPGASSDELDLLRANLVPKVQGLAELEDLDPDQAACAVEAFEKLPDRYIVQYGNGDGRTQVSILLTVLRTCVEAN